MENIRLTRQSDAEVKEERQEKRKLNKDASKRSDETTVVSRRDEVQMFSAIKANYRNTYWKTAHRFRQLLLHAPGSIQDAPG